MVKKGDTLIEVALAIGIFSMVAIAIVAVMVSGTSNAQNALETTLAREEIDTQAEALRFIHSAYLADEETGDKDDPYTKLWKEITKKAYTPSNNANDDVYLKYSPSSCEIFDSDEGPISKGFVINTRALNSLTLDNTEDILISYNQKQFRQTSTFPRLIYNSNSAGLLNDNDGDVLNSVEGIYVLAVKDPETTNIIGSETYNSKTSAYYDFYIRTCWYGTGSETPSTISTVIRLYDPAGLQN